MGAVIRESFFVNATTCEAWFIPGRSIAGYDKINFWCRHARMGETA